MKYLETTSRISRLEVLVVQCTSIATIDKAAQYLSSHSHFPSSFQGSTGWCLLNQKLDSISYAKNQADPKVWVLNINHTEVLHGSRVTPAVCFRILFWFIHIKEVKQQHCEGLVILILAFLYPGMYSSFLLTFSNCHNFDLPMESRYGVSHYQSFEIASSSGTELQRCFQPF